MRRVALVALAVGGSSSHPASVDRPANIKPRPFELCLGKDKRRLAIAGGLVVACSGEACASYAEGSPRPTDVPPPAIAVAPRAQGGSDKICKGETCTPLGKHLVAAMDEQLARTHEQPFADATDDLAWIVFDGAIWDVAKDRSARPRPPVKALKQSVGIVPVGGAFVASWTKTGDACPTSIVVDKTGKNRGQAFPGGAIDVLDDHRFVVAPACGRTLSVVDNVTGKVTASVELPDGAQHALITRVDANTAALLWQTDEPQLAWVHLGDKPAVGAPITLLACSHP